MLKIILLLMSSATLVIAGSPAERLSQSIRFKTISDHENSHKSEFKKFHRFLRKEYPLAFSKLQVKTFGESLLLIWKGSKVDGAYLFAAHQDVVPVDDRDLSKWDAPPFEGKIVNGYVWGRGALDDKLSVMGLLETVEALLNEGFAPSKTFYFAFGHDEEIGGHNGASKISQWLSSQNVKIDAVFDEGEVALEDTLAGIEKPVALIGIAEKGYASYRLSVQMTGGHSSLPPKETAIGVLAKGVAEIEEHPLPSKMTSVVEDFFESLQDAVHGLKHIVFAHPKLFSSMILKNLEQDSISRALVTTTLATTVFQSGVQENVLPNEAYAVINARVNVGDHASEIQKNIVQILQDDRIHVSLNEDTVVEPSQISSVTSTFFNKLKETIYTNMPGTAVSPALVVAMTDSRHYAAIARDIYRFTPVLLKRSDLHTLHGINEKISEKNYDQLVSFYKSLLKNLVEPQTIAYAE